MPRLEWDARGRHFYELGVDRGVLYVGSDAGVAWVGLTSVSENPTGGDPRPYYVDGLKYLNLSTAEEFAATINAFSAPPEFGPCDGTVSIQNGLFVTQQPRKQFSFSYRSMVGNETQGSEHGYKIHLVYNALAAPSNKDNRTVGNDVNIATMSWSITTLPPAITGFKPTAHLVIDSRNTDPELLQDVEDILYGSSSLTSRIPTPDELIALFSA